MRAIQGLLVLILSIPLPAAAQPAEPSPASQPTVERSLEELRRAQQKLVERMKELEQKNEEQSLTILKMQAESATVSGGDVVKQADEESNLKERVFQGGERALQALNPEVSIVGDMYLKGILGRREYASESDRTGFVFRTVGLHLQSDLDPFSYAKVAIGFTPEGVGLGEAYMTWTLGRGFSLTAGKFRQELGVVNRWHIPGLDQVDYPLALREVLGPEGLNQIGLSLEWLMPRLWAHTNQLVLQVTNGQNDRLFAGKTFSVPAVLLRVKSYYDLTENTYFELGLTGMLGWNNKRGVKGDGTDLEDESWRSTWVYGADWTLMWEPVKQARYRNFVARGELYGAEKTVAEGTVRALGLYQYLQARLTQQWEVGARFDWSLPFEAKRWSSDFNTFGVQPYLSWWQSPWVRLRLLYAWTTGYRSPQGPDDDHRVLLQATFAAGPHKHERY
jgi:hypothetical protein